MKQNKRKKAFANKLHKEIFLLVFAAALIPTGIATISLYYLIFGVTAEQFAIPEVIAYNIIPASEKVTSILFLAAPVSIFVILILAYKVSHKIVGPFDRIVKDLDDRIKARAKGHIGLRKGDKFQPLVDKINRLLDKL